MTSTNLEFGSSEKVFNKQLCLHSETKTLAGTVVLDVDAPSVQFLDPGGAGRTVRLPLAAAKGKAWVIVNEADAAEVITVTDDAGSPNTLDTIGQAQSGIFLLDSTGAYKQILGTTLVAP